MMKLFTYCNNVTFRNDNRVSIFSSCVILYILIFLLFSHTFFSSCRINTHKRVIGSSTLVAMLFLTTAKHNQQTSDNQYIFHNFGIITKSTNNSQ